MARARKWTFAVVFTLVTAVLLPLFYMQRPLYSAEARVLVEPLPPAVPSSTVIPPNLQTESQLVASEPIASRVISDLGLSQSTTSLLEALSVEAIVETEILALTYTASDPVLARDAANSFAENYITYRRQRALEGLLAARDTIQKQVETVQQRLADNTLGMRQAGRSGNDARFARLDAERNVLIARVGVLQQRLDAIQPESSLIQAGSQIIEPARRPSSPSSPNLTRDTALSVALAILLGVGAAFLRERLDDRFRSRNQVTQFLKVPVLAVVPRFGSHDRDAGGQPIVIAQPQDPSSEAYRTLRTNIEFNMQKLNAKSILVASASQKEGKTLTAANLGVALAQVGKRVVLVSADFRRPTLERYFRVSSRVGLSTWLVGAEDDIQALIQPSGVSSLAVLASGPVPPSPAELLASPRLVDLMALLEASWDWVLFDSPAILPVADAMILGSHISYSLFVVNAATTHRSSALHAKEQLQSVGVEIMGCILTESDGSSSSPSSHHHGNYSGYAPKLDETSTTNGSAVLPRRPRVVGSHRSVVMD